jgi:hypothetical protein
MTMNKDPIVIADTIHPATSRQKKKNSIPVIGESLSGRELSFRVAIKVINVTGTPKKKMNCRASKPLMLDRNTIHATPKAAKNASAVPKFTLSGSRIHLLSISFWHINTIALLPRS